MKLFYGGQNIMWDKVIDELSCLAVACFIALLLSSSGISGASCPLVEIYMYTYESKFVYL